MPRDPVFDGFRGFFIKKTSSAVRNGDFAGSKM